jgi:hypothetical protein
MKAGELAPTEAIHDSRDTYPYPYVLSNIPHHREMGIWSCDTNMILRHLITLL